VVKIVSQIYKKCRPVSRILFLSHFTTKQYLIIYLDPELLRDSIYLPFGNEREALKCRYTWYFTA